MEQHDDDDSMPGQDSFIDVVCNMVGILIVLVMIVGVRASRPAEFDAAMTPKKLRNPAGVEERIVDATPLTQEINAAIAAKNELEARDGADAGSRRASGGDRSAARAAGSMCKPPWSSRLPSVARS